MADLYEENGYDGDTIDRVKKFISDFKEKCGKDVDRMRRDRKFASGDQWSVYKAEEGRPEAVFNIIDNFKHAIVNPFLVRPFDIQYSQAAPQATPVDNLNEWVRGIQDEWNTKNAIETGIDSAVDCGRGFLYVTNSENKNVCVYAVDDPTLVMFDPNSTEINGADADMCIIIEYVPKRKVKAIYGDAYDEDKRDNIVPDLGDSYRPDENMCVMLNFYERITTVDSEGNSLSSVQFTKFADGSIVQQATLPVQHIPVVPFCGVKTWMDKHRTFVGITHKLRYPQMVVNYAGRQLMERLARTPKSMILIGKTALQGNEPYYKNVDKNLSPLLLYNDFASNGAQIAPPQRFDNSVQCDDIIKIMSGQMEMMSTIVGMPLSGIANGLGAEETAESILLRTKSTESNVSHFTEHAKQSCKQLGVILLEFYNMYSDVPVQGVRVVVGSGPEAITSKMEARRQLLALSQLYPETMKPVIAWAITRTLDNPEIAGVSNMLSKLLPPEVLSDQIPQVQQLQQQLQQVLAMNEQQVAEKDRQIEALNNQIMQLQMKTQSDFAIATMNNATKEKIAAMNLAGKQAGEEQKANLDAQKLIMDAESDQRKAEIEIAKTQTIAQLEIAKKEQELRNSREKFALEMAKKASEPIDKGVSKM